ncbi:hypothetical protein MMC26_005062 [Xylographa opegraphella]|nr:hypothetical protein [Xylographa opegraphella]
MKVTITCRFTLDGIEMDNEADCRFFFMLEKRVGRWGVCFYTLLFDKVTTLRSHSHPPLNKISCEMKQNLIRLRLQDKMVPVVPDKTFTIPEEEARKYPSGYRYLAWCENKISQPPKMDLNSHGPERDILYAKCKDWLDGKKVQPNLTGKDVVD